MGSFDAIREFVSENKKLTIAGVGIACVIAILLISPMLAGSSGKQVVRVGYFPNIQHSQAVVGVAKGDFQRALGNNVDVQVKIFNAGPSAIEALFAGELDIVYIGPNPAITGYVQSHGEALQVVAGACSGGAAFVVRNDSGIAVPADLAGKKFASPQLGNTQDVALRNYILQNGMNTLDKGGTVEVVPTANSDILSLFKRGDIQGAWVPEPWAARLIMEGNGSIFIDERSIWPDGKFVTANIIVRKKFLDEHPDLVKTWLRVHVEETQWINANKEEAKTILNAQIKNITGAEIRRDELDSAFTRLTVTYDPVKSSLFSSADSAYALGFLGTTKPDLSGIYNITILNEVLREKGLQEIS